MNQKNLKYSIVIQWSDEDQAYLVILPEFGPNAQTHGDTYSEAFKNAQDVMESLISCYQEEGLSLPEPWKYGHKTAVRVKKRGRHAKTA
jgi:predicted RNase H-like HicB family nuclease